MGLYAGMGFPWGTTLGSYFNVKSDRDILRTSIQTIIFTRMKERLMVPGFGSPIYDAIFEPGDDLLDQQLEQVVKDNVQFWDRRLNVVSVSVATDGNVKTINVIYQDKATPDTEDRFTFTVPVEIISRIT